MFKTIAQGLVICFEKICSDTASYTLLCESQKLNTLILLCYVMTRSTQIADLNKNSSYSRMRHKQYLPFLGPVLTTPEEFENRFHSENTSNVFRPHYARGI